MLYFFLLKILFEIYLHRCDQCSLPFLSAWKLDRHVKEIHMTLLFKCKETRCVESYATQEELDEHFKEKHLRIKCPHCDSYINSNSLQTHIEENHNREKEVLCDLCGVVCKNNSILHWHRTSVHEAEPRAQCDICKIWYVMPLITYFIIFGINMMSCFVYFSVGAKIGNRFVNICEENILMARRHVQFVERYLKEVIFYIHI